MCTRGASYALRPCPSRHPCLCRLSPPKRAAMLTINDLSLRIAGRLLIDHSSLTLPSGSKAGLVGRNGTGKTTLFNAICGEISAETGSIGLPKNVRIGQVAQEAPGTEEPLIDIVLKADTERLALMTEEQTATDPHRIAEIHMRLADIDAHSAEARAATILAGLGFDTDAQKRPASSFSGGWRMRIALAAVLFAQPDVLLLDEPTNYLDLEGTLWLEDHLANYQRTVLVVSHDRDLLDHSVDHILHLSQGRLALYRGNYTSFERQYQARAVLDLKAARKRQAERQRITAFVERFRAKASKARQAQSRLKLLERLADPVAPTSEAVRPIVIPAPTKPVSPP